tara:strand:+ start:2324 stop:2779 length:456 start_codon:yes stop_codon:yes gene_type:complete
MYIVHSINDFDINEIYFNKSVNNTVIDNGKFTRVLYSCPLYTINSLLYTLNFTSINIENNYTKYKCFFSCEKNKDIIHKIRNIESIILEASDINKNINFCISEQLKSGYIKLFENTSSTKEKKIILKISGIWETETDFGLTFKFMLMEPYS